MDNSSLNLLNPRSMDTVFLNFLWPSGLVDRPERNRTENTLQVGSTLRSNLHAYKTAFIAFISVVTAIATSVVFRSETSDVYHHALRP